jgi:hypothetical protein
MERASAKMFFVEAAEGNMPRALYASDSNPLYHNATTQILMVV